MFNPIFAYSYITGIPFMAKKGGFDCGEVPATTLISV